jgi:hypothetical protein
LSAVVKRHITPIKPDVAGRGKEPAIEIV